MLAEPGQQPRQAERIQDGYRSRDAGSTGRAAFDRERLPAEYEEQRPWSRQRRPCECGAGQAPDETRRGPSHVPKDEQCAKRQGRVVRLNGVVKGRTHASEVDEDQQEAQPAAGQAQPYGAGDAMPKDTRREQHEEVVHRERARDRLGSLRDPEQCERRGDQARRQDPLHPEAVELSAEDHATEVLGHPGIEAGIAAPDALAWESARRRGSGPRPRPRSTPAQRPGRGARRAAAPDP